MFCSYYADILDKSLVDGYIHIWQTPFTYVLRAGYSADFKYILKSAFFIRGKIAETDSVCIRRNKDSDLLLKKGALLS